MHGVLWTLCLGPLQSSHHPVLIIHRLCLLSLRMALEGQQEKVSPDPKTAPSLDTPSKSRAKLSCAFSVTSLQMWEVPQFPVNWHVTSSMSSSPGYNPTCFPEWKQTKPAPLKSPVTSFRAECRAPRVYFLTLRCQTRTDISLLRWCAKHAELPMLGAVFENWAWVINPCFKYSEEKFFERNWIELANTVPLKYAQIT